MKKTLTAVALAVVTCVALTGPAGALNKPGAGGSLRRCAHWVNTTNQLGWPIEYCTTWK